MRTLKKQLLLSLFIATTVAACGIAATQTDGEIGQSVSVPGAGAYIDILPHELQSMISLDDLMLVNVHVPFEGDIPDTDASVPFDQIIENLGEFPLETGAAIVVYCRSGSMSAVAARALFESGYSNIYNLDGGFRAWEAAGYELIR